MFENITGVVTGSEMPVIFCIPIQVGGLKGEGQCDNSTWMCKTHHPYAMQMGKINKLITN